MSKYDNSEHRVSTRDHNDPKTKVIKFEEYKKLAELFIEAVEHLEYTAYGDSYERECARDDKLPDRLGDMITRVEKILELNKEK